jgi:uncharacterized repeat protein (TIGR01451 family)
VSVATHTSVTSGEPSIPTFFGRTDLTAFSGPSLTAGGPHLVDFPGLLHNFAQCTPPHAVMTDSHILPPLTFGHTLTDGVPVTVSVTGAQLGLPAVEDGTLTITMTTIKESTGTTSAAVRTVITIDGTLNGTGGTALYSGPLATLTLGDVSAQCSSGPTPADVQVTKDAPATVTVGGAITYVLTVVNNGPGAASDVTVQDELNAGLTDVTGLPSGCSLTGRTVLCDLGTMALGEVREIRFSATVEPGIPPGGVIENCGTGYTSTPETDYANNESCVATAVESPLVPPSAETDIAITKTGPAVVSPGGTVSYTLTVSNKSSSVDAHHVEISDVLGEELSAVTGVPAGCTLAGRVLTCDVQVAIPVINVSAPVIPLGLTAAGTVEVPSLSQPSLVSWFDGGPTPGQRGPAALYGHIATALTGPAVFFRLSDLQAGDTVEVTRADHRVAVFRVYQVAVFPKTSFPTREVYGPTTGAELRLITCGGPFDQGTGSYLDNVVVFARLSAMVMAPGSRSRPGQ